MSLDFLELQLDGNAERAETGELQLGDAAMTVDAAFADGTTLRLVLVNGAGCQSTVTTQSAERASSRCEHSFVRGSSQTEGKASGVFTQGSGRFVVSFRFVAK